LTTVDGYRLVCSSLLANRSIDTCENNPLKHRYCFDSRLNRVQNWLKTKKPQHFCWGFRMWREWGNRTI